MLLTVAPTPRLELPPLGPAHAEEMAAVLADPALYAFTGGTPYGVEELRARYARLAAGSPDPAVGWVNRVLRLRADGRLAGYVQATVTDGGRTAEVAWVVGTPWQGRGLAAEAATALVGALAGAGAELVVAHVHPEHRASERVAAAAGLHPTDRVHDGERRWEALLSAR
ncbi:GNAT family N-acetyltransferase [Kitasatospora sp. NBC_01539]|uniref:GNAT family N-acetyltransferase n=1 Tax=Kitasatospora sp. NBC_01539 TaxID=2903577 RepID=UPI0038600A49